MKLKIQSDYIVLHQDVNDGEMIKILDEGTEVQNRFNPDKTDLIFLVLTPHGGQKKLRMNTTSKNNMIKLYGGDTENWINKETVVEIKTTRMGDALILLSPNKSSMVEATK